MKTILAAIGAMMSLPITCHAQAIPIFVNGGLTLDTSSGAKTVCDFYGFERDGTTYVPLRNLIGTLGGNIAPKDDQGALHVTVPVVGKTWTDDHRAVLSGVRWALNVTVHAADT